MFYRLHFCAAIIMTHPAINNKYKKKRERKRMEEKDQTGE